eukprot:GGOE01020183.1.p1 GENE.GGOE01020183.1~~GGOE01020183.1.p1  ORF type:complete len:430 (-),score=84.51 GGOE01020183.1:126-1415(-)
MPAPVLASSLLSLPVLLLLLLLLLAVWSFPGIHDGPPAIAALPQIGTATKVAPLPAQVYMKPGNSTAHTDPFVVLEVFNGTEQVQAASRRLQWATACLALSGVSLVLPLPPFTEYAAHYRSVLQATAPYRTRRATVYKGIRNDFLIHFSAHFMALGPRHFWPLVPLFMDDCPPPIVLHRIIDKRFVHVAVSMGECGLDNVTVLFPNLLVLAANGYGHVPIPLVASRTLPLSTPRSRPIPLSWCGRTWPGVRERMRQMLAARRFPFQEHHGSDWAAVVAASKFTLCPRGNGRTSFRLFEALQLGTIPVYIWDDCPWLPFQRAVDWSRLAILLDLRNLSWLPAIVKTMTLAQQESMRQYGQTLRGEFFTMAGLLRQLQRWLEDPSTSALTCRPLPCSPGTMFPCARRRGVRSRPHVSFCCNRSRCSRPLTC